MLTSEKDSGGTERMWLGCGYIIAYSIHICALCTHTHAHTHYLAIWKALIFLTLLLLIVSNTENLTSPELALMISNGSHVETETLI